MLEIDPKGKKTFAVCKIKLSKIEKWFRLDAVYTAEWFVHITMKLF